MSSRGAVFGPLLPLGADLGIVFRDRESHDAQHPQLSYYDPFQSSLVQLVSNFLDWKTDKIRAFVVALLENCDDHQVANQVNDILSKSD